MTQDDADMTPPPEFSRLVKIEPHMGAGEGAYELSIEAEAAECEALAKRFSLISIERFKVKGRIEVFAHGRQAHLSARLIADVTQPCVVSLAPVPAHLEEDFIRDFDRAALSGTPDQTGADFDVTAADPPDPLPERGIDVGEVAAEQLGLALDPYPRAKGVNLEIGPEQGAENGVKTAGEAANPQESPFSVLRRLKER
jgi:hypothetical protein